MNWLTKEEVAAITGRDYEEARRLMDKRGGELVVPSGAKIMMAKRGCAKQPRIHGYAQDGSDVEKTLTDPPGRLQGDLKSLEGMWIDSHVAKCRETFELQKLRLRLEEEGVECDDLIEQIERGVKKTKTPIGAAKMASREEAADIIKDRLVFPQRIFRLAEKWGR